MAAVQATNIYITTIAWLLLLAGGCQACENDWTSFEGSCYLLGTDKVTWTDAEGMCRLVSSNLAKIDNTEENDFIQRFVANHHSASQVWIGATDVFSEGHFVWVPGGEAVNFTDWASGEPNHRTGDSSEDCVMLEQSRNWQWNDNSCSTAAYFVCEKKEVREEEPVG